MQHILHDWLHCQGMYIELQPVFGSPDIMSQMPTEGQMYAHLVVVRLND